VTTSANTGITIAQQDRNGDLFRRLIDAGFSGGDVTVLDELLSSDFVEHQAGVQPANAEGVKGLVMYLHQALPDLTCTIEDMVTVGDKPGRVSEAAAPTVDCSWGCHPQATP
jgi:SnoaL-like polyketide cyclase